MHGQGDEKHEPWLLIKERDSYARPEQEFDVLKALPDSVITGQPLPGRAMPLAAKVSKTAGLKNQPGKQAAKKAGSGVPEGAVKAQLPETLAPQLATLVNHVPADPRQWVYEIKFDGYRLLARIDGKSVRCLTRNGNDWTAKLHALAQAVAKLGIKSG